MPGQNIHRVETGSDLYLNRFVSGLYTNRNPLFTPISSFGLQVISKQDTLIDGLNVELTPQMTLARRPGYTPFNNTNAFGASEWPLNYFSARINGTLYDFVDTPVGVYTFGTSSLTSIFTKTSTAQSFFQQVGQLLYFSDGAENKKWDGSLVTNNGIAAPAAAPTVSNLNFHDIVGGVQYPHAWSQNYVYNGPASGVSTFWLEDSNGNIQFAFLNPNQVGKSANSAPKWNTTVGGTTIDGSMRWVNAGPIGTWVASTGTPTFFQTNYVSSVVRTLSGTSFGPTFPYSQDSSGSIAWTNNTLSSNQLRSSQAAGDTNFISFTGFGFNIPAAATITGIKVTIGRANKFAASGSTVVDKSVKILKASAVTGTEHKKTGNWPSAYTQQVYGSNTDLWGGVFAPSDINAAGFGVGISATLTTVSTGPITSVAQAYLLSVFITVYYTLGSISNAYSSSVILDSNGNLQRIKTLGSTGGSAPAWATTVGATTNDNTMVWECLGSGNLLAALVGWTYAYSFHTPYGVNGFHTSTLSPFLSIVAPIIGDSITVQGTGSDDTQCDKCDLYRNYDGGPLLYYNASENNINSSTTWTHIDTALDTDLNTTLVGPIADANDPPPAGMTVLGMHQGRMWGAVGNSLCFSAGPDCTNGDPFQSWPPANKFTFPDNVIALVPSDRGLIVGTQSKHWIVLGGPQTLSFFVQPLFSNIGVLNNNCVVADGSNVYVYTSNRQLIAYSFSGKDEVGEPIADKLRASFDPSTSCLAVHRNGDDKGLYISDGSANVYRMDIDSGAWSPVAQPVGGIGLLKSIETSSGIYTLLAGRAIGTGSDYILSRNLSVFTDGHAASTYSGFGVIGSITLSPPGQDQPASLKHVILVYKAVGADLTLSVLPNEISGSFTSIPFSNTDPPKLSGTAFASSTVKMREHDWMGVQAQLPNLIRHIQVKVTLPTEAAKNELLGISLNV